MLKRVMKRDRLALPGWAFQTGLIAAMIAIPVKQAPTYAATGGWSGSASFAFFRNYPAYSDAFHDRLSVTVRAQHSVSRKLSVGPEVGYHGFWSADAVQCGPEWGVDCPVSNVYRAGAWEGTAIARFEATRSGLRPYALAGAGPYLAGNFIIENRQAKIDQQLQAGVTAGAGFRYGPIGVEGRWHYIQNGLATYSIDTSLEEGAPVYSYGPLRLYSVSLCIHIN